MNPIAAFFAWLDARRIARAQDAKKNQFDIAVLRFLRPTLLFATLLSWGILIWIVQSPSQHFPPGFGLYVMTFSAFLAASYAWVASELVFCRYVQRNRA